MGEQYVQVAPDSTGKKIRTWEETINSQTVQNQVIEARRGPCYVALQINIVPAASKCYLGILNGSGSGKKVLIHRAMLWNNTVAAVTGGEITCRYVRITALSGGTTVSPLALDSANASVPSQIVIQIASTTSTEDSAPAEFFSHRAQSEEANGIATALQVSVIDINAYFNPCNALTEHVQKVTLPEGKGLAIKQGSESVTGGAMTAFILFELL